MNKLIIDKVAGFPITAKKEQIKGKRIVSPLSGRRCLPFDLKRLCHEIDLVLFYLEAYCGSKYLYGPFTGFFFVEYASASPTVFSMKAFKL